MNSVSPPSRHAKKRSNIIPQGSLFSTAVPSFVSSYSAILTPRREPLSKEQESGAKRSGRRTTPALVFVLLRASVHTPVAPQETGRAKPPRTRDAGNSSYPYRPAQPLVVAASPLICLAVKWQVCSPGLGSWAWGCDRTEACPTAGPGQMGLETCPPAGTSRVLARWPNRTRRQQGSSHEESP